MRLMSQAGMVPRQTRLPVRRPRAAGSPKQASNPSQTTMRSWRILQPICPGVGGIHNMRTIVAFLLGIAVTVGAAYYHDTVITGAEAAATKRVVNWEVVREVTGSAVDYAQAQ